MGKKSDPQRIAALDGVRGLAVLVVIVHNAAWVTGESSHFLTKLFGAAAAAGWVVVQLFFVLSGFLITGILLETRERAGYFRNFYLRRALRIFPLYFALLAATVFLVAPLSSDAEWAAQVYTRQWAYWLYVSNWVSPFGCGILGFSHLWSLAVEEQFYLVWPLMVWWLGTRGLTRLAVVMVLAGPLTRFGLRELGLPVGAAYEFTIARWDALAVGALVAIWWRDASARLFIDRWRAPLTILTALSLGVMIVWQHGFHAEEPSVQSVGQSLTAVLSGCLIAWAIADATFVWDWVPRVLTAGWLRNVGQFSYGMYLLHVPIHVFFRARLEPWVQRVDDFWLLARALGYIALVLVLSYGGARVTWRLIEQPCLALKARLAPRTP